jgi:hypothetical protein
VRQGETGLQGLAISNMGDSGDPVDPLLKASSRWPISGALVGPVSITAHLDPMTETGVPSSPARARLTLGCTNGQLGQPQFEGLEQRDARCTALHRFHLKAEMHVMLQSQRTNF